MMHLPLGGDAGELRGADATRQRQPTAQGGAGAKTPSQDSGHASWLTSSLFTVVSFLFPTAVAMWREMSLREPDISAVYLYDDAAAAVYRDHNVLERAYLPRHALPWVTIDAAVFRTPAEWARAPLGRDDLLPFPASPSAAPQAEASGGAAPAGQESTRLPPEITVTVYSPAGTFRSYYCADEPNRTRVDEELYMDPARRAVLDSVFADSPAALKAAQTGAPKRASAADLRCRGCTFQCVHPRFLRGARGRGGAAAALAGDVVDGGALSWDVSLEDVDAGLIQLPGDSEGGNHNGSSSIVTVTRNDLFTCKMVYANDGPNPRDVAMRRALLLSTDVWLAHYGGALPFYYVNYSTAATLLPHGASGGLNTTTASSLPPSSPYSLVRLLPLHTVGAYEESIQSFPGYALWQAHWTQFDAVYMQQRVRRPSLLPRPRGWRATSPTASGKAAAVPPGTSFSMWGHVHLVLHEFQLIVFLNQQLRAARAAEPQRESLTENDAPSLMAAASGVIPRMAVELLHGADTMLLPMEDENFHVPATSGVRWRPPSVADWSGTPPHNTTHEPRKLLLPFSAGGRIPAIAAAISNCWHGRMWWLSELSRYYPVHNFGRCNIPPPPPMPGDAEPPSAGGIPQRVRYGFPAECKAQKIYPHHDSAMERARRRLSSSFPAVGRPRSLSHENRNHELRCVFRKYKYVLAFENTVEDGYVTEKVYNALLSGALPLYVGAMNIDQYVPQGGSRAGSQHPQSSPPSASPPPVLSVLPVLQMFPILNETAMRLEDRRIVKLHEEEEAISGEVLRTHAATLRTDAAQARRAAATSPSQRNVNNGGRPPADAGTHETMEATATLAEWTARAMEAVARQAPNNSCASHFLLYNTAPSTAVPEAKDAGSAVESVADLPFHLPLGTWPAANAAAATPPASPGETALTEAGADRRTASGFPSFLWRLHHDLTRRLNLHAQGGGTEERGERKKTATKTQPKQRSVTIFSYPFIDLFANTARGFAEEVAAAKAKSTRVSANAVGDQLPRGTPALPDRIEAFHDYDDTELPAGETGKTSRERAAAGNTTQGVWLSRGNAFSEYYVRRRIPPAAKYEAAVRTSDGPPMSGFAQLAAYLRALDADPGLVEQAGYFDWWKAERMEDFGGAFLEKLYIPHPICSICAGALEKKERRGLA
ncbi:hypothetical protein ABB37_08912 [Leptomonas pyrrhocoris]|nr:hypothetical protein ABB37_08912 [Leptomonas pyrrhocoris]XP_015653363.1 hypothetical protein ABB37_08912 [Leptomonas pyrrhocoris]XP_015653364.1 hypothetical protein ABB37_08912 [Leptomonas pyrrhocoris]KPA74923.1 hypothetical protein ABB37_08912 [Leptomonas pyrrhocoris]KPA74924.1 hypothetical protein ABB37_08912 [Leptomonas pyrrhocoris]KPA74925.1 hypothetical protein ABB37_08912 [Leptomonas pyrrhocoris]|eukprot:XP_015653362.1 hypothetical protein ABB37_08912 [Leptomonas pyrrhocoris]